MADTFWPGEYRRTITTCKAMRVTSDNLEQIAAWVGGHTWASAVVVPIWTDGKRGEDTAPIGSWVVEVGLAFQVWTHEMFAAQWQAVTP